MSRLLHLFKLQILLCIIAISARSEGKFESLNFPTKSPGKDFIFPQKYKSLEAVFRNSLKSASEKTIVSSALLFGAALNLNQTQIQLLSEKSIQVYKEIESDEAFKDVKSALPYCFSKNKKDGHYFLYSPEKPKGNILFLHGYGGNFLLYLHLFKNAFPDYRVIIPSYGVSWDANGFAYLDDLFTHLSSKSIKMDNLWISALSGGGQVGFEFYRQNINKAKGYICLASCPFRRQIPHMKPESQILMINGKVDQRLPLKHLKEKVKLMKPKLPHLQVRLMDSDHFFLLTQSDETFQLMKNFMSGVDKLPQKP